MLGLLESTKYPISAKPEAAALTPISHHLVCDKVGIRGERGAGGNRLPATRRRLDRATMGFEPVRQHERRRVPRPQNPNRRLGPRARIYKDGCSDRVC